MKGSAVTRGLKSLTDKLHPQLPLTSRESHQLLTALTASFRRHLNEAHPDGTDDGHTDRGHGRTPDTNARTLKSSAAYADRHLASVLTNPLFARPSSDRGPQDDFETARVALTRDRPGDAVSLLEDYDRKGAATVAIAELCLDFFKKSLDELSYEERDSRVRSLEPGRRVFLWLLRTQNYSSSEFADSPRLIDLMCYCLFHEGREDAIWDWLQLDLVSKGSDSLSFKNDNKLKLYQYRWRSRVMNALIRVKLGMFDSSAQKMGLAEVHAALDAFLAAFKLQQSAQPEHHLRWFPLTAAAWTLRTVMISQFPGRSRLDVKKYDQFSDSLSVISPVTVSSQSYIAGLRLRHPRKSSAELAWTVAQSILLPTASKEGQRILQTIRNDELQPKTRYWYTFLVATVHRLKAEDRMEHASWIEAGIKREFPSLSRGLAVDLQRLETTSSALTKKETKKNKQAKEPTESHSGLFLPSFG